VCRRVQMWVADGVGGGALVLQPHLHANLLGASLSHPSPSPLTHTPLSPSPLLHVLCPPAPQTAIKASVADNGQQAAITDLAAAMKQPGVKVQSLVPALWNLDRLDQQQLPLDAAYRYGSPTSSGTGEVRVEGACTADSGTSGRKDRACVLLAVVLILRALKCVLSTHPAVLHASASSRCTQACMCVCVCLQAPQFYMLLSSLMVQVRA
jgi:hypothetical protein